MTVNLSQFDWQAVSAIAAGITVLLNIFIIAMVVVGYRSLRESVLSRDASLLTWAIQRMTEIKEDLDAIRQAPPYGTLSDIKLPTFVSPWVGELEDAAYRVSVELQRLSYLANSGLISKVHLQKMWGPTFVEAWDLLETWVKHTRLRRGEPLELSDGAFSRNDFEKFALESRRV
jgi:hypothetical protein